MAKKGTSQDVKATSQNGKETSIGVKDIVDALKQVTAALSRAGGDLEQLVQSATAGIPPEAEAAAVTINTWDDPFSEISPTPNPPLASLHQVNFVSNTNTRLRTKIVDPPLPARLYPANTPGFRYWVAAEALARGIKFWSGLMPAGTTWSTSNPMRVILVDATPDLNARYRRSSGLHFYRRDVANRTVYSGESPDVVCHELGHAVLDALRPQFFNVADAEAAAFHESFGDMSAILCALQDETTRRNVLVETQGRLNVNSRLSRLAEQLGWGIRQISPTAVDRDSLRNAANRFFYRRIDALPPSAPANLLSSEPHSFSRIFTGAFLDVLARMYSAPGRTPDSATLLAVSRELGHILVDAVLTAPITTGYFSQVAAAMIQADQARFGGQNRSALTSSFIERGILSIDSAVTMTNAPVPAPVALAVPMDGAYAMAPSVGTQAVYAYDQQVDESFRMGYGETPELPSKPVSVGGMLTIEVHAPVEQQRFEVASAMAPGSQDDSTLNADTAIRLFVEGLIQRREVDVGSAWEVGVSGTKVSGGATHTLVAEGGKQVLKRNHFECGFCKTAAFTCD
jgi:hypothetical protein